MFLHQSMFFYPLRHVRGCAFCLFSAFCIIIKFGLNSHSKDLTEAQDRLGLIGYFPGRETSYRTSKLSKCSIEISKGLMFLDNKWPRPDARHVNS